jgi:aminopeptidase
MADPRIENLAKILVNYSTKIKPGDWVLINSHVEGLPLASEVVRQVLRAGGHANTFMQDESLDEAHLSEASDEQLAWISPVEELVYQKVDVLISLRAAKNTRALSAVDPAKMRRQQVARRELFLTYMRRSAEGSLRWVVTQFPCLAYAQEADMSLRDYEDFVYGATFADRQDPVTV